MFVNLSVIVTGSGSVWIIFDVMEKHFAALKLLDSDNDCKLTRAFSYSELPSAQRICVKQSFHSGNPSGLVRQYSYEQIFDKTTNTRQLRVSGTVTNNDECEIEWQTMGPESNFSESSNRQFCKSNSIIHTPKFVPKEKSNKIVYDKIENANFPNDAKFSLYSSSTNTNVSDTRQHLLHLKSKDPEKTDDNRKQFNVKDDKNKDTYDDIKKKFRPLVAKKKSQVKMKGNRCCCSLLCLSVFPIIIAILALFFNFDSFMICNRTTLFSNASLELPQKIYGQGNAISNVIKFLNTDTFYVKVVCLVGGTGVGKSYTAEIIAKNFPHKNNIFMYDPVLEDTIDVKALNSSRLDVLLIMENLRMKDLDFFSNTMSTLSQNRNKCITVLAVFNFKGNSVEDEDAIRKAFVDTNINFLIVRYEPLNVQVLEMCITEAARNSNMTLTLSQINVIKQGLLFSGSGCKGAYSKVQVIGRE